MPDLLRTFIVRNPTVLTRREIDAVSIHTHPPRFQSPRFKRWTVLCKAHEREALQTEIVGFLRGADSVKQTSDLGEPWQSIVDAFFMHGPTIPRQAALQLLDQCLREDVASDGLEKTRPLRKCDLHGVWTNIADTVLGLVYVKRLSHPQNIDYQSVLRVLAFAERAMATQLRLPELNFNRHFERPILFPTCFFDLDPCKEITSESAFPFLHENESGLGKGRVRPRPGCIDDGKCTCKVNDECLEPNYCCAKIRPYVVDLMVVRDQTKCYQAGDLSYIKNILAGETLSTTHRRLERTEEVTEREEERSRTTERDLQIDDKSALQKEINETVKSDLAIEAGITANASWGAGTKYELNATSNFSYNKSKEAASKEVRDYSRNVIDRSNTKLEEKVNTLLRTTRIVETEETNEHGFTNMGGPNISGQYLYVNKVSKAQVFNYGKKAVLDLSLPEPAALYIKLLEGRFDGVEPAKPQPLTVTANQITPDNYETFATQFGLKDVPAPPPFRTTVEVTLEGAPGDPEGKNKKSGSRTFTFPCTIPNDYAGVSMSVTNVRLNYNEGGGVSIAATLGPGGNNVSHVHSTGAFVSSSPLPAIEGNHTVVVHCWDVTEFTWILTIDCELNAETKAEWQNAVFAMIQESKDREQEKYEQVLQKYLDAKNAFEEREAALKAERNNRNPFINRETERTEIKRIAISYISCQFFDDFDAMKSRVKPCGYPQMDIQEAESEGLIVQFFEHAIDWSLFTYVFYRYFWGRKCTWRDKLREESNDLIFQQFLAAGSARVLLPIRDGFFDLVQYFLVTGEIWGGGGTPPVPGDPHYVSVAQEMKEQRGNYYADRDGRLDVTKGSNVVTLNDTDWYWIYDDSVANPPVVASIDAMKVGADIDREIIIDCKAYRIVEILPNPAVTTPVSWLITLDRNYEGETASKLPWSTGALYVGAPWEFVTPTTLTFLRGPSPCLPCYPLKECKE
jgi:hypothetical protein